MDISTVLNPGTTQSLHNRSGDAVSLAAAKEKVEDVESNSSVSTVNSVVNPAEEVPADKLPAHLGRNLNTTA